MQGCLFKILSRTLWAEAEASGSLRGAPVDLQDGYIHLSTRDQVEETAARHFAGQRDLMLVAVDSRKLEGSLRLEPSRGGDLFPHLYAALPIADVLWARPLPSRPDGKHDFTGLLP